MAHNRVMIVDGRPDWMRKEDELMACLSRCPLFKRCSTRAGTACRHLGGDVIPKIRNKRTGGMQHAELVRRKRKAAQVET